MLFAGCSIGPIYGSWRGLGVGIGVDIAGSCKLCVFTTCQSNSALHALQIMYNRYISFTTHYFGSGGTLYR